MKIVILCGGMGTRLREETEIKPKPMIEIGGMPILWHIMKAYARYGFDEFILCLGYKGEQIKEYFYNYEMLSNDFTIELGTKNIDVYPRHSEKGWKVTLVDTGSEAMTGARIKRVQKFIGSDTFMLTYGDGVADINIENLLEFHKQHGKIGTVTAVTPPSRYGELIISEDHVMSFTEKPQEVKDSISGGYFIFSSKIFDYLKDDNSCVLEKEPLSSLALDKELKVYKHKGFWQCMDTYRDYKYLQSLWDRGDAPWKIW
jgi:glucose-1-phosphate cytidylyltransferase